MRKEYSHQCVICHKPFVSDYKETLACSPECALKAILAGAEKPIEDMPYEQCFACGISFTPYHSGQKFCCKECRESGSKQRAKRRLVRQCRLCGKSFKANSNPQVYCSKECRTISRRNMYKKK